MRENETIERKKVRLAQWQKYNQQIRENETPEYKKVRLEQQQKYDNEKLKNKTIEAKQARLSKAQKSTKQKRQNKENCQNNFNDLVKKFHEVFQRGQYIFVHVVTSYGTSTVFNFPMSLA